MTPGSPLENVADAFPLSPVQQGMLYHSMRDPESDIYVTRMTADLSGSIEPEKMKSCWTAVQRKYAALRTIYVWDGLDEPLQVVLRSPELDWHDAESDVDFESAFDLQKRPPFRVRLVQLSGGLWRLEWRFHHIVVDGWSTFIVMKEVVSRYNGDLTVSPDEIRPVREFHDWLEAQDESSARKFWNGFLSDVDGPCLLADSISAELKQIGYDRIDRSLKDLDVAAASRRLRVTLGTLVSGAWSVLIGRYLGRSRVIFGSTSSGRPANYPEAEKMVGMFLTTQPVVVNLDWQKPIPEFLAGLQQDLADIRQHEHIPLTDVQKQVGSPTGGSLFDSLIVIENLPVDRPDTSFAAIEVSGVRIEEHSEYPIALLVSPGDPLELHLIFDSSRFDHNQADRILDHFSTIFSAMLGESPGLVSDLPMLTPREVSMLTETLAPGEDLPISGSSVLDLIEQNILEYPANIAACSTGVELSYAALGTRSNELATRLVSAGVCKGDRVGIFLRRSAHIPVALLGVMKSGGAFVLLDPTYPPDRIRLMLDLSGVRVIVSEREIAGVITGQESLIFVDGNTDQSPSAFDSSSVGRPERNDLAYIMFTSGSSGAPKGVAVSHGNLLNSTSARRSVYPEVPERFLLLSSAAFDSSLVGFFWTLTSGGTLVIPDDRVEQNLEGLARIIQESKITHTLLIPTLYSLLLEETRPEFLASMKTVIVAGEACHSSLVAQHFSTIPDVALVNEYGPTETTVWCLAHRVTADDDAGSVPIGRPIANARAYVVGPDLNPLPPGLIGELVIGGANVALGYWNDTDATNAGFINEPLRSSGERAYRTGDLARLGADGLVEFLGRADGQLKIRGYRVETAEIERVLSAHSAVMEAVVVPVYRPIPIDTIVGLLERMDTSDSDRLLSEIERMGES